MNGDTLYTDENGTEYEAIHLTWEEVEEILGEPHRGDPAQDDKLAEHLLENGAPEWVKDASGWVDEFGWGLIGPALD